MKQFKTFILEEDCYYNISKSLNYIDKQKVQLLGMVELLKNELEVNL